MLFRSLGNNKSSLGVFLKTLGSDTISYRGSGFFEAVCAAHVYLCNVRNGKRCCLHIPSIGDDLRELLISIGCVTGDATKVALEFFQDEDVTRKMEPYSRDWKPAMQGWKGSGDTLAFYLRPDFQPPKNLWEKTASRLQRRIVPFSWGDLQLGKFGGVFTTDWKMRFAMHLLGIPSFLISGPLWPQSMFKLYSIPPTTCLSMQDNAHMKACPCPSPKVCHQRASEIKPCWSVHTLETSMAAFARQIGK